MRGVHRTFDASRLKNTAAFSGGADAIPPHWNECCGSAAFSLVDSYGIERLFHRVHFLTC
ncbi:hypothetical protein M493_14662 [Geobacillus genomosp. 3]|uniref:Uncharacterized protein n=1 Tax=Geobacillus genomosp. 3 TaxID=1921421 RepID=V5LYI1_GEOG3|nr:hypothetical protein M493_14662 [Geobacillus genomosp. 3]